MKRSTRMRVMLLFPVLLVLFSHETPVLAGDLSERELLLQISEELALLQRLSRKGRDAIDVDAESARQFDYHALEIDLAGMRQAILQHLFQPVRLPRMTDTTNAEITVSP